MRKSLLLLTAIVLTFGVVLNFETTEAQSPIDVNEGNYRVPVIGDDFEITRLECPGHVPGGSEPGIRFMDINVEGAGATDEGTPIYSSGNGTVEIAENGGTAHGLYIEVHNSEVGFRYMHLAKIYVSAGQQVYKGDLLGYMGNTGHSEGPHLHWEAWPMPGYSFNIVDIPGVNDTTGSCTPNPNDGTIDGPSRFRWDNCPDFYNEAVSYGTQYVILFDHKDCRGNAQVLPWSGYAGWNLSSYFNDRTRSIFVPPGFSIIISAHADDPDSLYLCHTNDMWNLDVDNYTGTSTRAGWQGGDGYNMVSFVTVRPFSTCPSDPVSAIVAAPLGGASSINTHVEFASISPQEPQYGDSHVDIRENTNYQAGQYGWDNPTNGWFNVPDYMDDRTSSIAVDGNFSIKVAKNQNGGGATKCLVTSYTDLSGAYYDDGSPMTDTISSVWVYADSTCGGTYIGTEPGDTVTVWNDTNYWSTHYGWHDPATGNVPDYVRNQISSIGITPGWSVGLYENQNQGGGFTCLTASDPDLQSNWFNNGAWVNDNVESIAVFHDTNCGGWLVAPTYSMQVNILDQATGWAELVFTWSNAQESWQVCTFGDGGEVGYFGQSGTSVGHANGNNHDYNPGTYTATCTIVGRDGVNYQATQQVTYTAPQPPTLSLTATVTDPIHGLVETNATWNGAREDWQVLNWGDGAETGYFGASGTNVGHANGNTHYFQPGTYNLVFTVKGLDGQNYMATQSVTINPPSYSLIATVTEPNTGLVTTNATWSNAENDWQILQWGDGTETGYQGSSGTNVGHANGNTHYYQPGTYTLTFNVKGGNGTIYPTTQQVTINPPTYSLAVTLVDNQTMTVTTDADWSNADNAWHVLNWGDGTETGYFGPQGTNVGHENGNTHQYATTGTYTLTFTVHGAGGSVYTTTQQVTVGS